MGPGGQSSLGDYVMTERGLIRLRDRRCKLTTGGFDHILEQLMQQAGPQGPIPASDTVIEGLPRLKLDEESLGALTSCPPDQD
jgi:E3 ubiquitin-protein ligase RNF115/126